MRISGGDARGIRLKVPKGARPASEKVRQAVFSSLGPLLRDASVLDLYCGSGAYGLEALSRGATLAVFVDDDAEAISTTRENARSAGMSARATIERSDVKKYLTKAADVGFDLAFVDPPYSKGGVDARILELLSVVVVRGGRVIWELTKRAEPAELPEGWFAHDDRRYGDTRILVLERKQG